MTEITGTPRVVDIRSDATLRDRLDWSGIGGTEIEQRVDELPLLEVVRFRVDIPDVVLSAVHQVHRRQDRGPHRVILIVVTMKAVASASLDVCELLEIGTDSLKLCLV